MSEHNKNYGLDINPQGHTRQTAASRISDQIFPCYDNRSIPNPRFIKNKEASFYRYRLEITNQTSEKASIKVFGMNSSDNAMEEIASQQIYILSIKQNKPFVLINNKIRLEYEVVMLKNYQEHAREDEDSKTEVNLETQTLSDGIHFQPNTLKRSATFNQTQPKQIIVDNNSSVLDKSPLLSDRQIQHAHQTFSIYKQKSHRSKQMYDDLSNHKSDFNFMQPITHTPPRSPKSSPKKLKSFNDEEYDDLFIRKKKCSKEDDNHKKHKSRCDLNEDKHDGQHRLQVKSTLNHNSDFNSNLSSLVLYAVVAIVSFVIGVIVKQR